MPAFSIPKPIVPTVLGLAMLAVVVAAALAPNTGAVAASSNCQYNDCTQQSSTFPWVWVGAALAIVAAGLITLLLLRRRRGGESEPEGGRLPPGGSEPASAPTEPEAPATGPVYDEGLPDQPPAEETSLPPASEDIDSLMNELDKISGEEK